MKNEIDGLPAICDIIVLTDNKNERIMKRRALLLMIFAFLQTCVALSAEPFTKKQYEEMVRQFNDHQQSNVKQPFDKWTTYR